MEWNQLAMIMPFIFLAYQLLIDWANLFPWNDIATKTPKTRLIELLLNYSPLLLIAYGFYQHTPTAKLYALIGSVAYLIGHLNAWWRPYLFGASAKEKAEYEQYFSRTYKFLPPIGEHPIPDSEHVVLGFICLLMVGCSCLAYFT